jgi:hypothetical protein
MAKFSLSRSNVGTARLTQGKRTAGTLPKQAAALAKQREQRADLLARFRARCAGAGNKEEA